MLKKRINIVLLILVLGLWGAIGYKTVNQYFFSKEQTISNVPSNMRFNFSQFKKDTFNLEEIERDPFLNKSSITPDNSTVEKVYLKPKVINKPIVKPKLIINWPLVSYYGYIKSKDKTEELILVKIDNKLHKLRKNESVDGVIIKKVFNDSIEVFFNKERKIIRVEIK
ncbi:hypothetical protein [Flavobacterium sp.]|uniref:hypothetical protein n=1 Tax=Flavobacterium sp. TaxID=239 RepID=UPI0038FC4111